MAQPKHAAVGNGLVAVLLITRSRPGPRLVFHYPEVPNIKQRRRRQSVDTDESESGSEDEDENISKTADVSQLHISHNGDTTSERLLGHAIESLEKLLSPGRWCDGKKFEVCVSGLTFLGHPIYSLEDGEWIAKPAQTSAAQPPRPNYGEYHMYLDPESTGNTPPNPRADIERDFTHIPDSLESHALGTSMQSSSTSSGRGDEQISMFHVVFVLISRGRAVQNEVQLLYREVAKKLCLALQHLQKHGGYVASESRRILAVRAKAKHSQQQDGQDLWKQLVETSELAWALKETYEKIFAGGVAGIKLNGMEMSLHTGDGGSEQTGNVPLDALSALLLLEPKETLLPQLSHPEASPLAHFIREHTPTKNVHKHAVKLGFAINDVLYLARHLIKWRKAQVIFPLHQRNTYVVAPDAPLERLHELVEKYSKTFPTLPSLPNMLKILSGKPIQYGLLIPSRDHSGAYMDILGFLVQHRLVAHLKTYGWLRLPANLATLVAEEEQDPNTRPLSVGALLSPHLRPVEDDQLSVSSARTAIPTRSGRSTKRLSTGSASSRPPSHAHTVAASSESEDHILIEDPSDPTAEEAELLAALTRSLTSAEMREHFPDMLPFFDGRTAFEEIAARLGLKRAPVEQWLDELEGRGYLLRVRHI